MAKINENNATRGGSSVGELWLGDTEAERRAMGRRKPARKVIHKEHPTPDATVRTVPGNTLPQAVIPEHIAQLIRRRAYELYERGGRVDGHAEEDWRRAEAEILGTVLRRAGTG